MKAMNYSLGSEGLVLSALVLGEFPKAYFLSKKPVARSTEKEKARIAASARREIDKGMAEVKLKRALQHKTPNAVDNFFRLGDWVLFARKIVVSQRFDERLGFFTATHKDEIKKVVCVQHSRTGAAKPFSNGSS